MANKKLRGIVWPNLPNDTYLLDAGEVDYSAEEAYRADTAGKALQSKAEADGYYSNLTAGSAEQLLSTVTIEDEVPYLFRTSGGANDIGDRETDMLVGGTVAWNQLIDVLQDVTPSNTDTRAQLQLMIKYGTTSSSENAVAQNITSTGVKTWIINADRSTTGCQIAHNGTTRNLVFRTQSDFPWINGHKYLFTLDIRGIDPTVENGLNIKNGMAFDLTQMFGSTIADAIYAMEQATAGSGVAFFRKLFPKPYYAYNAGELKSVSGLVSHDMTGFNQWDEEWEVGDIDATTGANKTGNYVRAKNLIPVIPNTNYYVKNPIYLYIYRYGADGSFIARDSTSVLNSEYAMPSDTHYIRFVVASAYGTTYNHDICINLSWDGERNGEYEPYVLHSYPLDDSLTLRGIPKISSGSLYYDGDTYESDGTVTRKYGVVDLGSLDWLLNAVNEFTVNLTNAKGANYAEVANALCEKYSLDTYNNVHGHTTDKTIAVLSTNSYVYIYDTAYSDTATFKSAMSGVYLVYELATPTTETADPYTNPQIVNDFGTEEYVSTSIVPVGHVTQYMPNLRAKLEMAPDSPDDGDGDYIVRQTNGQNEYVLMANNATIQNIISRLEALEGQNG